MKPTKEPIDNIRCPVCLRNYSYIRARVTLQDPKRDWCLVCCRDMTFRGIGVWDGKKFISH